MFDPMTALAIVFKTSLLLVAVCAIVLLIARQSAAWRHFLWTSALALSLLMPLAVVYLPSYVQLPLPRLVVESAASDAVVALTQETITPSLRDAVERRALDERASIAAGERRLDAEPYGVEAGVYKPSIVTPGDLTSIAEREESGISEPQAGASWLATLRAAWPAAIAAWFVGTLLVLLRNAVAHLGLIHWIRKARDDLSPAWAATLRRVTSEAGFRRSLRVLESEHTTSPCTWGLVRPVLLLPAGGAEWPEAQRRFALLHELAHIRRCDYLTAQVASFACAMHWYNPVVWFAAAQARKLQEQACDDAVLRAGEKPSDYAQFLVRIAAGSQRWSFASPAAVGMAQRSQLYGRVTAILDQSRARLPLRSLALLIALAPLVCLMVFLGTVSAVKASVAAPIASQVAAPVVSPVVSSIAPVASPVAEPDATETEEAAPGALQAEVPVTATTEMVTMPVVIPLSAPFTSVELRNGGKVHLVHGATQRVTFLQGDPGSSPVTISDDGRLVIDHCPQRCQHRRPLEVEIVTPALSAVAVAQGGTLDSRGAFPRQPEIRADVHQGGTIDIRSIAAVSVTASVYSGGRIYLKPETNLVASVEQGGLVTYWGDPVVTASVVKSAGVVKGNPADVDKALTEFDRAFSSVRPIPAVPAVPAVPSGTSGAAAEPQRPPTRL